MPGYAHYPNIAFAELLPNVRPYNENAVALNLDRLKKIYYSDSDFVDFIELLERNSRNFRYYGNTELLFIKYIAGANGALGRFDFNNIYRFNLSRMYYLNDEKLYPIERFLEEVLQAIHSAKNDDELIASINNLLED